MDRALRELVLPWKIDFGVLAGFVPLCNITADLPCLNVHPGDLTVETDGRRILAGLHFKPVETAILAGHPALRSSVILAQPFEGSGEAEMDSGPVLGVSRPDAGRALRGVPGGACRDSGPAVRGLRTGTGCAKWRLTTWSG